MRWTLARIWRARGTSPVATWLNCHPSTHSQTTSPDALEKLGEATCTLQRAQSAQPVHQIYLDFARHATSIHYRAISRGHLGAVSNHTVAKLSCATAALRCMRRDACFMSCTAGTTVLPAHAVDSTWHCPSRGFHQLMVALASHHRLILSSIIIIIIIIIRPWPMQEQLSLGCQPWQWPVVYSSPDRDWTSRLRSDRGPGITLCAFFPFP